MRILPTTDPLRGPQISIYVGEIAPGCDLSDGGAKTRLNVSTLCFLSHPGAISLMGANPPMGANSRMITVSRFPSKRRLAKAITHRSCCIRCICTFLHVVLMQSMLLLCRARRKRHGARSPRLRAV